MVVTSLVKYTLPPSPSRNIQNLFDPLSPPQLGTSLMDFLYNAFKTASTIYFEDFIKDTIYFTPSEQFCQFSLQLQNMSLSQKGKYKQKIDIFCRSLGEIRGDKSRDISSCFSSHQELSLSPSLSLISSYISLSLLISR